MQDIFNIQFSTAEDIASSLLVSGDELDGVLRRLHGATNRLYSSGLQGAFLDDLEARTRWIENELRIIAREVDESGRDLNHVTNRARQVDADSRLGFGQSGYPARSLKSSRLPSVGRGFVGVGGGASTEAGSSAPPRNIFSAVNHGYKFMSAQIDHTQNLALGVNKWLLNHNPDAKPTWMQFLNKGGYKAIGSGFELMEGVINYGESGESSDLVKGVLNAGGRYILGEGSTFKMFDKVSGGIVDYGLTGDAGKIGEGVIQGAINIAASKALVMNQGAQLMGDLESGAFNLFADWLAGGDPAAAENIRQQAQVLQAATEQTDLSNLVDSVSTNVVDIFQGDGTLGSNLREIGGDAFLILDGFAKAGEARSDLHNYILLSAMKRIAS